MIVGVLNYEKWYDFAYIRMIMIRQFIQDINDVIPKEVILPDIN